MFTVCKVESVEYSFLICNSVNLRSDVYIFSVLQHSCFLHSQPAVCSVLVGFGLSFALRSFGGSCSFRICCLGGDACLLSGSPKMGIRNREETENLNPESTNQRKQVLQIRENLLCRILAFQKTREQVKKSSNKNSLSVEICATVRAMIMRIENKVPRK